MTIPHLVLHPASSMSSRMSSFCVPTVLSLLTLCFVPRHHVSLLLMLRHRAHYDDDAAAAAATACLWQILAGELISRLVPTLTASSRINAVVARRFNVRLVSSLSTCTVELITSGRKNDAQRHSISPEAKWFDRGCKIATNLSKSGRM